MRHGSEGCCSGGPEAAGSSVGGVDPAMLLAGENGVFAISTFSSQNPKLVAVGDSVFVAKPSMPDEARRKMFGQRRRAVALPARRQNLPGDPGSNNERPPPGAENAPPGGSAKRMTSGG